MNKVTKRACYFVLLITVALILPDGPVTPARAELPSIIAPLAEQSLLLDIASHGKKLIAVGERGHVLVSDNDGQDWRQVQVPTRSTLTGVFILDEDHAWAVGHDAVILRSSDGGYTWQRVFYAPEQERPLLDVRFADKLHGITIGAYGFYLESSDGGLNWNERTIAEEDFHLNRISAGPYGELIIAAEAGNLYHGSPDGTDWGHLPSPYHGSFFAAAVLDMKTLVVAGLRGHLFKSTDGGQHWTQLPSRSSDMLTDILVTDDHGFIAVGLDGAIVVYHGDNRMEYPFQEDRKGMTAVTTNSRGEVFAVGRGGLKKLELTVNSKGEGP